MEISADRHLKEDANLRKGLRFWELPLGLDPKMDLKPLPDANAPPKVAYSGDLRFSSSSDVESARLPISDRYNYGSSDDVELSVTALPRCFIGIMIASVLKCRSLCCLLAEMVLFLHMLVDTVPYVKAMVPKRVFDVAGRLCHSAASKLCEAGSISVKPNSGSSSAATVSKLNPAKSTHSDPDSSGKTSAEWVVTSAAPHHSTGNRDLFCGFITKHDDQFVHAVHETPMQVIARGTVIARGVALPDVWLVTGLKANLVSVSQLVDLNYSVEFGHGMCYIRSTCDGMIVGKAHLRKGGMYVLDFLTIPLDM